MSLFSNLTTDTSIKNETDSVGGNTVLESGLYSATVTMAYGIRSEGGATGLVLQAKTDQGNDIRQTLWMTSGTAKGGQNFYTDKSGTKQYLPGFIAANALALLTTGKEISELDMETKVVNVYNKDAKAEVPTKVEVPVDLLGKEILIGVIKQTVDKTQKNDAGVYVATGETRDENEIDKFFRASDRKTTAEIRAQAEEATFATTWEQKWAGKSKDKSTKGTGVNGAPKSGFAGAAANAGAIKKPTTSLFA